MHQDLLSLLQSTITSLKCSLCFNLFNNSTNTKCGHRFCYNCIKYKISCPICYEILYHNELIFNYHLNQKISTLFPDYSHNEVITPKAKRYFNESLSTDDDELHNSKHNYNKIKRFKYK